VKAQKTKPLLKGKPTPVSHNINQEKRSGAFKPKLKLSQGVEPVPTV
jgi:hypothetical protein